MATKISEHRWCALLLALVFLAGCQTLGLSYRGKSVAEEKRIALLDRGEDYGYWQTRDLTLDYQYVRNQSKFEIVGVIRFAEQLKNNFSYIEYFHMDVILLDEQGTVLEMRGLTSSSYGRPDYPVAFDTSVILPPNTASIAFSYRGQARSNSSDNGGSSAYFWEYPIR